MADKHFDLPIIVLTNYATPDIRERCKALGAVALFDKSKELDSFFASCSVSGPGVHAH